MPGEFDIIQRYFTFSSDESVLLNVGDDAAVMDLASSIAGGREKLVVATDTLIEGRHFPVSMAADYVASRALSVNISDFSAMGVQPRWYTLALSLPEFDQGWLAAFSSSLSELSERYGLSLVGGDTTRGDLSITLTLMGLAGERLLTRHSAKPGDRVWVTNTLGKGGAALKLLSDSGSAGSRKKCLTSSEQQRLASHFYAPDVLLEFGKSLTAISNTAIDISDGLMADAKHIAKRSGGKMLLDWNLLPVDPSIKKLGSVQEVQQWVLSHGDEYQLLFTLNPEKEAALNKLMVETAVKCTRIGEVVSGQGVELLNAPCKLEAQLGYEHF